MPDAQDSDIVAAAILALVAERGAGKTISPEDAAKAIAQARGEDDLG